MLITALLLIANGSEEIEVVGPADILRRAGVDVTIASIANNQIVTCSRDVKISVDAKLEDIMNNTYDAIILPGGAAGSKDLTLCPEVGKMLQEQEKANRVIAAICAAPTALKAHGIAKGKKLTSYPIVKSQLENDYEYLEEDVVVDGNLITSRGPATTFAFGLAIAEKLVGKEIADKVASMMLYK